MNIATIMTKRPGVESDAVVSPTARPVVVTAETASKKSASDEMPEPASVTKSAPVTTTANMTIAIRITRDSRTISVGISLPSITVSVSPRHIAVAV